ncbi:MAG TPA: hypothetical protein VHO91_21900 [Rhodopila sp.]|nr:hypothetical protein [Rhodopila sp.]
MSQNQAAARVVQARMLAANNRYEESLTVYAEVLAREPTNGAVFMEMLRVKELLTSIKSTLQRMQMQRDAGIVQGRQYLDALLADPRYAEPGRLERFGQKIYSQNDEDGIIAEIFRRIGPGNRTFFEFGVEDGLECNTHLLLQQGWSGAWAEASGGHARAIRERFKDVIAAGRLKLAETMVTRDRINDLVRELALPEEIDLISIDVDSNDYWIFAELTATRPRVIAIEYNAKFPPPLKRVIPYRADRTWQGTDYFGCSLQSLTELAATKGYTLVGCNITGATAFLVRSDLCADRFAMPATAEHLYQPPRYELFRMGAFERGHPAEQGPWLEI